MVDPVTMFKEGGPFMYAILVVGIFAMAIAFERLFYIVFSANINHKDQNCNKNDKEGCDLWMAKFDVDSFTDEWSVTAVLPLVTNSDYAEMFPDLHVLDAEKEEYRV